MYSNLFCFLFTILSLFLDRVSAQDVLKVSGNKVADANGDLLMLKGVNLGGWLVTENWMCGITDSVNGDRFAYNSLESRFSPLEVQTLINTWQDNWIQSSDLDSIKSMGFNFVRVPFGWRNLQDSNGEWLLNQNGLQDFSRFDWIVDQAAQRDMYVLFDYHVWMKQDSSYNSISDVNYVKAHTCSIWKSLANHFNGNAAVLGYDILNEPTGSFDNHVAQMIYDTIRSVDANHIISLEWIAPDTTRWKNVIYQDHYYGLSYPFLAQNQQYFFDNYLPQIAQHQDLNVPFYVGELHGFSSDSSLRWSLDEYCLEDVHWSPWTYKTVNMGGWGMLGVNPINVKVNVWTDSYTTILDRWSQLSAISNLYEISNIKQIWKEATPCLNYNQISEISFTDFEIFPNPVKDELHFAANANYLGQEYEICNVLGMKIYSGYIDSTFQIIPTFPLVNGYYFFKVKNKSVSFLKS